MLITTRLKIIAVVTIAAFAVLSAGFVETYTRTVEAKLNYLLDDEIRTNASARAFIRDQYFINHDDVILSVLV